MYTTWILQQVALNSYSAQLLVPGSPGLPSDTQTHTGSLWQLVWPAPRCPGVHPVVKSQTFWSLQYLAQTCGRLAPKPSVWLVWFEVCPRSHTDTGIQAVCLGSSCLLVSQAPWAPATRGVQLQLLASMFLYMVTLNEDFPSPRKIAANVV